MFVTSTLYHPYYNFSTLAGGVCYKLTQMVMVSLFKLIFYYNFSTSTFFISVNIYAKVTNRRLTLFKNKIYTYIFT